MEEQISLALKRFHLEIEVNSNVITLLDKQKEITLGFFKNNEELFSFLCGYEKGFSAGQWDMFNR